MSHTRRQILSSPLSLSGPFSYETSSVVAGSTQTCVVPWLGILLTFPGPQKTLASALFSSNEVHILPEHLAQTDSLAIPKWEFPFLLRIPRQPRSLPLPLWCV